MLGSIAIQEPKMIAPNTFPPPPHHPLRPVSTITVLAGAVLLLLGMAVTAALVLGANTVAAAGVLAVWTVLLGWSLSSLRNRIPAGAWWGLATAGSISVLAQLLLLQKGVAVFMQVNFISLHAWALLCAVALAVYVCFAPREEWLPLGLSIVGTLVLSALLPFMPRPLVPGLVAGTLGVLPAMLTAWFLMRGLAAGQSQGSREPRKLKVWPVASSPSAPISS